MDEQSGYELLPYDKVWRYNRHVVNPNGDPVNYDFNGILHLALAALDNIRDHALEADFEQFGDSLTEAQKAFFLKVARSLERLPNSDEV